MSLAHGMDIKTLSSAIGHATSSTTLNTYAHVSDEMRKAAAAKIDKGIAKKDATAQSCAPAQKVSSPSFQPYKGQRRKSGTGCVYQINENLWEGKYSPIYPDGKKHAKNIYAHSEAECEEKLKSLISDMKAEIAALKCVKN